MRKNIADAGKKTQWKKGQSGNPKGRPPVLPELDKLLAEILSEGPEGKSVAKEILKALAKKALKGDKGAAEILINRAYGKPKERAEIESVKRIIVVRTDSKKPSDTQY